jgi:hypothetical protein
MMPFADMKSTLIGEVSETGDWRELPVAGFSFCKVQARRLEACATRTSSTRCFLISVEF